MSAYLNTLREEGTKDDIFSELVKTYHENQELRREVEYLRASLHAMPSYRELERVNTRLLESLEREEALRIILRKQLAS